MVKVTLTEWIKDRPGAHMEVLAQQGSRDSEAELAAAIEASKLTGPGPYWDAQVLEDGDRCSFHRRETPHQHILLFWEQYQEPIC